MKAKELRELSEEEVEKKLKEFRQELFNLKFQLAIGQLENTSRIKQVKKDIARAMTVLNEKKKKILSNKDEKTKGDS
ncbi:MAG: 50S ribosomal protein L29 [Deltaproteobacteria bacterium]|nr:MAG: 50S ribosomal protein L29 [Deltaproteobacteria bacterium]